MDAVATAAATTFVKLMVPKLFDFLNANHELRKNLEQDINFIKHEFRMISATIEDEQNNRHGGGEKAQIVWINMVRELAHAIEDCIDRFMHRVRMAETGSGWLRRAVHRVKTVKARNEFAMAIRELKKISEEASMLKNRYSRSTSPEGQSSTSCEQPVTADTDTHSAASGPVPVGMVVPRDELLDLIQQPQQLRVISIVGFHGIGKTLLANHVYKATESQYEARAWIPPAQAGGKAADVLMEILRQLGHLPLPTSGGLTKLHASIKECVGTKRFFIVLDDLRAAEHWHGIKEAFVGSSGRFLVTTAIQRVGNICSSSTVHDNVYAMATLAEQHSRLLFFKEVFQDDDLPPDVEELGSEVLKKCDGLPLALVTTARFLQSTGSTTPGEWARLCANLGTHLERDEMFARMRRVLVHSYTSLDSQDVRTFLLYLGSYPNGRPIRKSSLIRRWLAEGFSPGDATRSALDVATENFKELINHSIIQPIDASGNITEVKTCHTHGMMLEFVMRKSMCDNFVTLFYNQLSPPPLPDKIRRLSLHHARPRKVGDVSLVRSLTIFGEAHQSVLDFSKYQLLRVLDLEECNERLGDDHIKLVCRNLLLLRYLSLGAAVTVKSLPKKIRRLQFLETLDVRRTQIEILPTQVMELPCLLHLFGKFKLKKDVGGQKMSKLKDWLSANSKLETVAGFVVDSNKSQGFAQLMDDMKHLTKVKIWCESTADTSSTSYLSTAVKGFIERSTDFVGSPSLSLNFDCELSKHMLNFCLQNEKDFCYYLGSLKLQGSKICSLPRFVALLGGLTKLRLSSPRHQLSLSQEIIGALSRVRYLKLVATRLEKSYIRKGELVSLLRLSIVVESMTQMEIQEGALPRLTSLQLLCKDLDGFSSPSVIQSLGHLDEIALHHDVGDQTKQEWKEVAKNHPRRPKILFI